MCVVSDLFEDPLGFRMLAWLMVGQKASARGMVCDMVSRRGEVVGVLLSRHRWGLGAVLPGIQDTSMAYGRVGGSCQRCGPG